MKKLHFDTLHFTALVLASVTLCIYIAAYWFDASYIFEPLRSTQQRPLSTAPASPMVEALHTAEHSILVNAYALHSPQIQNALHEARQRGVKVEVMADPGVAEDHIHALANKGIPVRINSAREENRQFMVIDNRHLQRISNSQATPASAQNHVLILWNAPEVANAYTKQWRSLWKKCLKPTYL